MESDNIQGKSSGYVLEALPKKKYRLIELQRKILTGENEVPLCPAGRALPCLKMALECSKVSLGII
jgi:hypothetical protein